MSTTPTPEPFWSSKPTILLSNSLVFFPTKNMTTAERLNAIARFGLYTSIVLTVYHVDPRYISIFFFTLFITYIIYTNLPIESFEKLDNVKKDDRPCTKPTIANPFMNFTMADRMNFDETGKTIDRAPACDPNEPETKKLMEESFNNNLYRDVDDVFGKMNSQRNYYTMPNTEIVSRQTDFANWLYKSPGLTCKESGDCQPYEDIRSNGRSFVQYDNTFDPPKATKDSL